MQEWECEWGEGGKDSFFFLFSVCIIFLEGSFCAVFPFFFFKICFPGGFLPFGWCFVHFLVLSGTFLFVSFPCNERVTRFLEDVSVFFGLAFSLFQKRQIYFDFFCGYLNSNVSF